jgi:hypothetical protein
MVLALTQRRHRGRIGTRRRERRRERRSRRYRRRH